MAAADETINSVCEMVYEEAKNLIEGFHRFYIALYDSSNSKISFPFVMNGDERLVYKPRNFLENSLPDFSISDRKTIVTNHSLLSGKEGSKNYEYWPKDENLPVSMICSPMLTGDKMVGALVVEKRFGQEELTERSARLLDEIAQLAAISIDRVYLYEGLEDKVKDRTRRLQAVHDIGVKLTEGIQLGEQDILELIKKHASDVMDTNNMYIALYEPDPLDVFDPEKPENSRVHGVVRYPLMYVDGEPKKMPSRKAEPGKYGRTEVILSTRESILHKTRRESEEWHRLPGHMNFLFDEGLERKGAFASWLGVPMSAGGKVIGIIATYDENNKYRFNRNDQKVLEMMASQAATAIENAWLYQSLEDKVEERTKQLQEKTEQLQEKNEQLENKTKAQKAVHEIGVKLTEGIQLGEEEIPGLIKEHADRVMDTDNMYIALYEPDPSIPDVFDPGRPENSRVHGKVRFGLMYVDGEAKEMPARMAEPGKYGRTEVILATREPILNRTREASEAWYKLPGHENFLPREGSKDKESFAGWLGVPMIVGGKPIGVIATFHREKEWLYDEDDQQVLSMMAGQAATAIENARLYSQMDDKVKERTEQLYNAQRKMIVAESLAAFNSVAGELAHKMNNFAGTIPARVLLIKEKIDPGDPNYRKIDKTLDGIKRDSVRLLEEAKRIRESTRFDEAITYESGNELFKLAFDSVKHAFAAEFEAKNVKYIEEYTATPFNLYVPRISFLSAIENIIRNAVEALTNGGELKLYSQLTNEKTAVLIISDTGHGIATKSLPHIFDPFYTTKATGFGFGLWQAKTLVNSVGGDIEVVSEIGKGTTFKLNLPLPQK